MFRWLTDQYPEIVNRELNELGSVDNFYLDMNGIIHPCTHGNNDVEQVLLDETAMFKKIFLYVDRLYKLVQPTTVLYLAVDGTAPRAKMNQQRSRRFRSAKEAEQLQAELVARSNAAVRNGNAAAAAIPQGRKRFDSNCITPGTDFMLKLNLALIQWVQYKMATDLFWKAGATVIISGPDVPGEGEHKVMDFVRRMQQEQQLQHSGSTVIEPPLDQADTESKPLWKKDATHVLYGLDADLIMLGLVTHERNFMLLRERMSVVMAGRGNNKYRKKKDMLDYDANDFEVLELSSFRKMLAIQFRKFADELPAGKYSLERVIDDFVFTCMLVGNDFLPHVPHLEIDSGALSLMMSNYIDLLPEWGDYLTKRERIHPQRLEEFLHRLSIYESEHFNRRGYEENEPGWKLSNEDEVEPDDFYGTFYTGQPTPPCAVPANRPGAIAPPMGPALPMAPTGNRAFRRQHPTNLSRSYRDFYYSIKLQWPVEYRCYTQFQRRNHVREYIQGLHWNLNYYHNGCRSWDWFFPYLYAPLCTDMVNLSEFYEEADEDGFCTIPFELGTPFDNLAQLLSVLPPQSADLLPRPLAELMTHPSSPLVPFYPHDFESDPNGKRQTWEAVGQIPFIDSDILLDTVDKILKADQQDPTRNLLSASERRRNERGVEHTIRPPGLTPEEQILYEKAQKAAATFLEGTMSSSERKQQNKTKRRREIPTPANKDNGNRSKSWDHNGKRPSLRPDITIEPSKTVNRRVLEDGGD
jgi:5'-3' exoribonuclease 1